MNHTVEAHMNNSNRNLVIYYGYYNSKLILFGTTYLIGWFPVHFNLERVLKDPKLPRCE